MVKFKFIFWGIIKDILSGINVVKKEIINTDNVYIEKKNIKNKI